MPNGLLPSTVLCSKWLPESKRQTLSETLCTKYILPGDFRCLLTLRSLLGQKRSSKSVAAPSEASSVKEKRSNNKLRVFKMKISSVSHQPNQTTFSEYATKEYRGCV